MGRGEGVDAGGAAVVAGHGGGWMWLGVLLVLIGWGLVVLVVLLMSLSLSPVLLLGCYVRAAATPDGLARSCLYSGLSQRIEQPRTIAQAPRQSRASRPRVEGSLTPAQMC